MAGAGCPIFLWFCKMAGLLRGTSVSLSFRCHHSVSSRPGPCISVNTHHHTGLSRQRKHKTWRVESYHLSWARKGRLGWFRVLLLLSFRWILAWLDFISSDNVQSMMCAAEYIMTLRSYSALCILHPLIIIMQFYSLALNICSVRC